MQTLQRWVAVGAILLLLVALPGCRDRKKDTTPEPEGNPLKPDAAGGAPAQGVVRRGVQRQVNQGIMENLGKYYELYRTDNGRPPKTVAEFRAYLQSDPSARTLVQAVDKDWIVFRLDPPPNSNQVLAYEKEAFEQFQNRIVLFGGGSVELMPEADFQAALKR